MTAVLERSDWWHMEYECGCIVESTSAIESCPYHNEPNKVPAKKLHPATNILMETEHPEA